MNPPPTLHGTHLHTYQTIFQHPIIGAISVDEHHLTEGELMAKARDFYTEHAKAQV